MKISIQMTLKHGKRFLEPQKIAKIDVHNGHWKYWDNMMETDKKESLTLNNISKATYLHQPVKDAISHHDYKNYKENGELVVNDASIRTYNTLLDYIVCRINNTKEAYHDYGWKKEKFNCILFEDVYVKSDENTVVKNIEYRKMGLLTVEMEVIE